LSTAMLELSVVLRTLFLFLRCWHPPTVEVGKAMV
jgi:hypothetical protein